MKKAFWFLSLAAMLGFAVTSFAAEKGKKKDPQQEAEEKEAAEEDAAAVGRDLPGGPGAFEFNARGKLDLYQHPDDQKPIVIGIFTADGKAYEVKAGNEELLTKLQQYNGKLVSLAGKLRNKGKYLVVQSIVEGAGRPDSMRNRRGL
jgi:hypothetical protein